MDDRKVYAYRKSGYKPGMFRSAGDAAIKISAWLLIGASLAAVSGAVVYRIWAAHISMANIVFSTGLALGVWAFFGIANRERSLIGRVAARSIAILMLGMIAISLGVL